jgi:hypothetical protein
MVRRSSKIICPKCRKKGGTLTTRLTGHSKKSLSVYIQHYDSQRRGHKRPCYITRHSVAHIRLTDKRFESEYKPLVRCWSNGARGRRLTKNQLNQLSDQALRLLIDMGWPDNSLAAADKFFVDRHEIPVEELALQYEQKGIKIDHNTIAKRHFKEDLRRALRITEIERKYRKRKQRHKKQ